VGDLIRTIVADDHPLLRDGVVSSLRASGSFVVVGEAADGPGAVTLARDYVPDLVLLDVTMPGGGLNAARDIAAACPATKIVVLTVSEDEDDLLEAMKAGACGYILKGVASRDLIAILRRIVDGDVYATPALAGHLLREMSRPRANDPISDLTDRERAVLEHVAIGLSNLEIGQQLGLSEKTIKHYMTNILGKLHVRSRVEAAILANQAGLGVKSDRGR
jgi:two-component system nitrate/nitrite response regulator NarL